MEKEEEEKNPRKKLLIFSSLSGLVQNNFTELESCSFPSLMPHNLLLNFTTVNLLLKLSTTDRCSDAFGEHHFFAPLVVNH